jgi:hypothetical protein
MEKLDLGATSLNFTGWLHVRFGPKANIIGHRQNMQTAPPAARSATAAAMEIGRLSQPKFFVPFVTSALLLQQSPS